MINEIQMPQGSCVARFDQRRIWPAARRKRNKRAGGNTWARVQMRIKRRVCCVSNIIPFPLFVASHLTILRSAWACARIIFPENTRVCLSSNNISSCTWYRAHLHVLTYRREKSPHSIFAFTKAYLRFSTTHLVFMIWI